MKNKKILLLILVMLFTVFSVKAENCDVNDQVALATEAAKVKIKKSVESKINLNAGCDLGTGEICNAKKEYYVVNILNLTENLYVEVTEQNGDFKKTIYYSDVVDGIASFEWEDMSTVANLVFKIYGTESSVCPSKYLTTQYYTLPRYNMYSTWGICEDVEDYYMCDEYVEFDEMDFDEFSEKVNEYKEKKLTNAETKSFWTKLVEFLLKYIVLIAIGIGIIAGVIYIVIKRKKSAK